jgi:hypothetical protein
MQQVQSQNFKKKESIASMFAKPGLLLRIEGWAAFGCALFFYHSLGASWGRFVVLFLWPDLFMLGYMASVKVGAHLYNLVHSETLPLVMAACSFAAHRSGLLEFSLIWLAHIALDRALGFGLKYPTLFKDTHLQRVSAVNS